MFMVSKEYYFIDDLSMIAIVHHFTGYQCGSLVE